ncbi:nucleotidyltransferase family protein [Thalassobius sp. S69A]|uniref:nucleotidyltransferase family protein n=1 Tax=unclassified Thalassovita TaxID=2619711 RepID=UPI000C4044F6|nr:4-diphosphocytidyl-2C-methyl-D-erythritol synthase [Paracoccaceae bacterium]
MERTTLILAAGSSSRMGTSGDKLLEKINNTPLLAIITQRAMAASDRVYVCLPGPSHPRAQLVQPEQAIWVSEAHEGMGATIRTGIGALPAASDVMILPADMPELTEQDLASVWGAHEEGAITRGASAAGRAGHPVIFPQDLLRELLELRGDEGARQVIVRHRHRLHLVPLPAEHALTDLDTPQAWAAWRAQQG